MGTRDLTALVKTELAADLIRPALFFEFELSTTINIWSGNFDISWDSKTWLGNGWLRGFSPPVEEGLKTDGISVNLSGLPTSLISEILNGGAKSKKGKFYLGFLDSAGAVIADPIILASGFLDTSDFSDSPTSSVVRLSYESELALLDRSKDYFWNKETQALFDSNDEGFDYISKLAEWRPSWGQQ